MIGAVAQLTDEQKGQILQGALDGLTDEQKSQIRETYIQQMMESDEVTSQINSAVTEASAASKQISDVKAQLDSYDEFYQGLITYTDGVSSAASGATEIKLNMDTLYSGTTELANGTSEFVDKTSGMGTQISDEVNSMVSSISRSDAKIVSFVSDKNTNVASVQFVIKTEAIEKPTVETEEIQAEASLDFWQKLLNLFKLD